MWFSSNRYCDEMESKESKEGLIVEVIMVLFGRRCDVPLVKIKNVLHMRVIRRSDTSIQCKIK